MLISDEGSGNHGTSFIEERHFKEIRVTYDLEALGEDRFQMLCQSILAATYPHVQCLPINQPDGGRDAFLRNESGFVIFQVKFSRRPNEKSERDAVASLIKTEKAKVDALIGRGASSYVLLTNISGTSHLDVGSIDRIQTELSAAFGIPTMCWWRDDLERRIDGIEGLIWRYPELIRSIDFLETIANRSIDNGNRKSLAVFRAYMEAQFIRDSEVKFQQVQIQNLLLDLFTDTPLAFAREKQPKPLVNACDLETFDELSFPSGEHSQHYLPHRQNRSLAADWLLRAAPSAGLQRIILEGAPGQGKSTVTQYVCQVNRIKSHPDYLTEKRIPTNHFDHIVRLPFRVDLRDYSTWLSGYDPFAGSKAVPRSGSAVDTLESFVSHQIKYLSGGMNFDVDMFSQLISDAHCLIVLDGFDEVADIPTRVRIIEQTRLFSGRVQGIVKSAQLIVTSRPNAFILSSGFPEREWMHLALRPLQTGQISEYADKWIAAKELTPIKGAEFKELLGDRVSRPHIRSLAQNPMQLAILLNLINTKGLSLPDKRTALYESYMDLFFGREAEKDEVVRENRDVLMQIHEYVAWLLQTDAERPGGAGSMTQTNLEQVVQAFLSKKGHEVDVLSLFQGAVERVGALVSRVQGMIEFEVQPLREFFAGRFLYVSAPYSTLADERGGSRPRRFAALARRPYWSNVARFYAGCYNSGELASLLQGLEEVYEDSAEAVKSHALQLGLLLLSDWVFAQEPRIVAAVVTFLTERRSFERLISSQTSWEESRLALPARCGRAEMGATAVREVINSVEAGYIARVGEVAVLNSSYTARHSAWKLHEASLTERVRKASALGLFSGSTKADLSSLIAEFGQTAIEEAIIAGRWDDLSPEEIAIAINSAATRLGTSMFRIRDEHMTSEKSLLRALWFLTPMNLSLLKYDSSPDLPFSQVMNRYGFPFLWGDDDELSSAAHLGLSDFTAACERAAGCDLGSWTTTLKPWSDVVESARRTWGQTLPVMTLAASAAGIRSKSVRSNDFDDLFAAHMPLSERARHARLRTTSIWWAEQWNLVKSQDDLQWISLVSLAWATGPVLKTSAAALSSNLDGMTAEEFDHFSRALDTVMIISPGGRPRLTGIDIDYISSVGSARLAFALGARLGEAARRKVNSSLAKRTHIDDAVLLSRLFGWFVSYAYREPAMWDEAVKLLTAHGETLREHERQTRRPVKASYLGGRSAMPQKLAESFLRTADYRPMVLLDAAASSVRQAQGADRRPLGEVAAAERWFPE